MNYTKTKKKRNRRFSGESTPKSNNKNFSGRRNSRGRGGKGKRASSGIDPNQLIKKAVIEEQVAFIPSLSFDKMPLNNNLKANLAKKGFKYPTQIQEETLEFLVNGRDMLGVASTGTGKTGAFLIPIIEQLLNTRQPFTTLVVVPTRELAQQVQEEFKSLALGLNLFSSCFIGGTSVGRDISQLRRKNHFIIGTPGRLMDLADRGALHLDKISTLVLDEFDRMLDMGFVDDIQKIVGAMDMRKQTMLFSATIDRKQEKLIADLLYDPIEVKVSSGTTSSEQVDQDIIRVPQGADKFDMLLTLMGGDDFEKVLIFAETKRLVDKVTQKLNKSGIKSELIHGDKSQGYRTKALNKFKRGNVKVLVATDVAARGIDVSDISHVINYQLPLTYDSYVHRIGRTGRAGKRGKAFTFVD